jgi:hypothetical protein
MDAPQTVQHTIKVNVQVDNQDSAVYNCIMFIRLTFYLPNTVSEKENKKCRNNVFTMSSPGGKDFLSYR